MWRMKASRSLVAGNQSDEEGEVRLAIKYNKTPTQREGVLLCGIGESRYQRNEDNRPILLRGPYSTL